MQQSNQNPADQEMLTPAAVLVPLVLIDKTPCFLFTKRTDHVRHHKGQVCFPGGMRDEADASLWDTAQRETCEEIGIPPERIALIGELPELATPTGFIVTPFTGFVSSLDDLRPNDSEIAAIFHAPIAFFSDPKNVRFESRDYFGVTITMPFFDYGGHVIWGATGRMILSFFEKSRERTFQQALQNHAVSV